MMYELELYDLNSLFVEEPAPKLKTKKDEDLDDKYQIYRNRTINAGKKPLSKELWLNRRERILRGVGTAAAVTGSAGLIAAGIGVHSKMNSTSHLMKKRSKLEQKRRIELAKKGGPNIFDRANMYERRKVKDKYDPKIKELDYRLSKAKKKEKGNNPLIKLNLSAFKHEGLIPDRDEYLDFLIEMYDPYDVESFVYDYMQIYDETFNY